MKNFTINQITENRNLLIIGEAIYRVIDELNFSLWIGRKSDREIIKKMLEEKGYRKYYINRVFEELRFE